jgi:hypothetical protein
MSRIIAQSLFDILIREFTNSLDLFKEPIEISKFILIWIKNYFFTVHFYARYTVKIFILKLWNDECNNVIPSWWLTINIDSVLELLHSADVGDVANVSKIFSASIFRVEMWSLGTFYIYISIRIM